MKIPPWGGRTRSPVSDAWEGKDVRLNRNSSDSYDRLGHLSAAQMAEKTAGWSTSKPGSRPAVDRMEEVGRCHLPAMARGLGLLSGTMERPLARLPLCGDWSRRPGLDHLLGDFGFPKRGKLTLQARPANHTNVKSSLSCTD